jgi:hypothetical protein
MSQKNICLLVLLYSLISHICQVNAATGDTTAATNTLLADSETCTLTKKGPLKVCI